jgi:hypothetical protein
VAPLVAGYERMCGLRRTAASGAQVSDVHCRVFDFVDGSRCGDAGRHIPASVSRGFVLRFGAVSGGSVRSGSEASAGTMSLCGYSSSNLGKLIPYGTAIRSRSTRTSRRVFIGSHEKSVSRGGDCVRSTTYQFSSGEMAEGCPVLARGCFQPSPFDELRAGSAGLGVDRNQTQD